MKIFDVTLPISADLPTWPGDPIPRLDEVASLAAGDASQLSALRLGTHTGTHVDAPSHLFHQGATVDRLPVELLVGEAWVCVIPDHVRMVDSTILEYAEIPKGTSRLILRTDNSRLWKDLPNTFAQDYVALTPDGARWIVDRGITLVGVDYLSVDPVDSEDLPAHRILLSNNVVVLEGLDLRGIPSGRYHLLCLPLRLVGADGAPARVFLLKGRL